MLYVFDVLTPSLKEPSRRKKRRTNKDAEEYRLPSGVEVDTNAGPSSRSRRDGVCFCGVEPPRMQVIVRIQR